LEPSTKAQNLFA